MIELRELGAQVNRQTPAFPAERHEGRRAVAVFLELACHAIAQRRGLEQLRRPLGLVCEATGAGRDGLHRVTPFSRILRREADASGVKTLSSDLVQSDR